MKFKKKKQLIRAISTELQCDATGITFVLRQYHEQDFVGGEVF